MRVCPYLVVGAGRQSFTAGQGQSAEFVLDVFAQVGFVKLLGDADRVADRFWRRTAMTDQGDLLAAEQRRPAEFRIVQTFLDAAKGLTRKNRPGLRQNGLTQFGLE